MRREITAATAATAAAGLPPNSPRAKALNSATTQIVNLLRAVVWLIRHGVFVTGFTGRSQNGVDRIVVSVAASPLLYRIFDGRCCWLKQRQEGDMRIVTWFAFQNDIRIEWEDTTCTASRRH